MKLKISKNKLQQSRQQKYREKLKSKIGINEYRRLEAERKKKYRSKIKAINQKSKSTKKKSKSNRNH